jgi:hypothetical protein
MDVIAHPVMRPSPASAGRHAAVRVETPWVRLSLGVVGLHVIDDNFLQPEPGVSPTDHLVSGLVPLALLAAAAFAERRQRAGARATWALLVGLFGMLTGAEAAYYVLNGGPSGDDFTGIAALLAGVALLVVGTVTLWRSRRTGDRAWRRYLRRTLITAGALVLTAQVMFPTAIAYVVTHTARAEVPTARLGAPHEDVEFSTKDGLLLQGWFVPSRNGATVIVFPGRSGPQKHARMLIRHGYGVLLFDRRGEGASEGDPNGFGWHGERDLRAAAAYLQGRPDVDARSIGGLGLSVGGEMLIRAAAGTGLFEAIVSEGASGQSLRDGVANGEVGEEIVADGSVTLATALFANDLPPSSLVGEVSKIAPTAVLFIYGENGQGGTETKPNVGFYESAGQPKHLWEVPDGGHIAGITTEPEDYERRVIEFFDAALLNSN